MTKDIPEPESHEDLRENEEMYQELVDEWNAKGNSFLGSVLLPGRRVTEMGVKAFHECMTEWGDIGIEYTQEALHQNEDYFDDFFDSVEEVREDLRTYKQISEEDT